MRIIDADNLKKELRQCHECQKCGHNGQRLCRDSCYVNEVADLIDKQQTVEVLIPRGAWSFKDNGQLIRFQGKWQYTTGGNWGCSNCHNYTNHKYNYCPYCGAQMSEEVQE